MEPVWFRRLPYAFMAKTGNSPSLFHKFRKQGRAVSTVTWVQAGSSVDGWLSGARYLCVHYVQTSCEAHPVTYSVGCIDSFPRGKADGATRLHLVPSLRISGAILLSLPYVFVQGTGKTIPYISLKCVE